MVWTSVWTSLMAKQRMPSAILLLFLSLRYTFALLSSYVRLVFRCFLSVCVCVCEFFSSINAFLCILPFTLRQNTACTDRFNFSSLLHFIFLMLFIVFLSCSVCLSLSLSFLPNLFLEMLLICSYHGLFCWSCLVHFVRIIIIATNKPLDCGFCHIFEHLPSQTTSEPFLVPINS